MLRILDRYVIREVLTPVLLALLILTFILEVPTVMRELEGLVAKGVSWSTAAHLLLLLLPSALGLTIPMSLLVGLLIGLGRLSSDRESVALLACGVSPFRLLRPILLLGVLAAAADMFVMIVAIPDANQRYREIAFDIISKKAETDVKPRVFFEDFAPWVMYPRDEPDPGTPGWKKVLVAVNEGAQAGVYLAERGRLVLDREQRRVDLILTRGTKYSAPSPGEAQTYVFPGDLRLGLNPDQVFPSFELSRNVPEKTIAELRDDIQVKARNNISTHNEVMGIHVKFSIPTACLVFALIALALGLTVSRDGKFGGFVVGVAVIFAYYIVMFLSESMAKGGQMPAALARWVPNLGLGAAGVFALVWRARFAERRFPLAKPVATWLALLRQRWQRSGPAPGGLAPLPAPSRLQRRVVLVVRFPRLRLPIPGLIDRYISRMYLRIVGLSFLALLGLFYISTIIDKSDKVFKGQATASMVGQLLLYSTPQFVYYIIPIAALVSVLVTYGLLTRSSELTVMKACGISLYRASAAALVLALAASAALFALEQRIMASANRQAERLDAQIRGRPPTTYNTLNRRWLVAPDGAIYHYGHFDAERHELSSLTIYRLRPDAWTLASQTFVRRAVFKGSAWHGEQGWTLNFDSRPASWKELPTVTLTELEPPEYFTMETPDAELMTVSQLRRYVAELSASGFNTVGLAVELQRKLAFPFVTVVMTLLAVPFGVSMGRRGALYGIGLGIVIALTYWIVLSAFVAIGKGGLLPPALAAWAPNVLVLGLAAYLFLRVRT